MTTAINQTPDEKMFSVEKFVNQLEDKFVELGALLSEIKHGKLYHFRGYDKFKEFVESEFTLSGNVANKVISIYNIYIYEMEMDEVDVKEIGMDRLIMIRPFVRKADWNVRQEWIAIARELTIGELRAFIKDFKAKEKSEDADLRSELIAQSKERLLCLFNCSWSEIIFKLSLLVSGCTDDTLKQIKNHAKELQIVFETKTPAPEKEEE